MILEGRQPLIFMEDDMANICTNYITIIGNEELIDVIAQDYIGYDKEKDEINFSFNVMLPIPMELNNNDYYWRIENWGNKWDGSDAYVDLSDNEISISVDTAWGPCDKWTFKLIELCPGVEVYHEYHEGGEGFIGWIQHYENEGPEDYEDVFYNVSHDKYEYWLNAFDKEYENCDWLTDHINDLLDDEEISQEVHDEILNMIENDHPLELLITKCIDEEIL